MIAVARGELETAAVMMRWGVRREVRGGPARGKGGARVAGRAKQIRDADSRRANSSGNSGGRAGCRTVAPRHTTRRPACSRQARQLHGLAATPAAGESKPGPRVGYSALWSGLLLGGRDPRPAVSPHKSSTANTHLPPQLSPHTGIAHFLNNI